MTERREHSTGPLQKFVLNYVGEPAALTYENGHYTLTGPLHELTVKRRPGAARAAREDLADLVCILDRDARIARRIALRAVEARDDAICRRNAEVHVAAQAAWDEWEEQHKERQEVIDHRQIARDARLAEEEAYEAYIEAKERRRETYAVYNMVEAEKAGMIKGVTIVETPGNEWIKKRLYVYVAPSRDILDMIRIQEVTKKNRLHRGRRSSEGWRISAVTVTDREFVDD